LAQRHQLGVGKGPNLLLPRLTANQKILRAYNEATLRVDKTRHVTPGWKMVTKMNIK
jgi:hypothetical protein